MKGFPIHTQSTVSTAARTLLEEVQRGWGFVPKLQGTLAESAVALEAHERLFALAHQTSFTAQEQQVALLTISAQHSCEYCVMGHTFLGRKAGVPEDVLQAVREGHPIGDSRLEALRRFVEAVVERRGFVDDVGVERFLSAGFTRAQVLEVLVFVALKTISNYADHLTDLPKEGFMSDPALAWVSPRNRSTKAA